MEETQLFSVKNLITNDFEILIVNTKDYNDKLNILLRLLDYESEYPDKADEISEIYLERTGERYEYGEIYISDDDREFLNDFAKKVRKYDEIVNLLDKICNSSNGLYDHDKIIDDAIKKISIIKDISNIELLDKKIEKSEKKSAMPKKDLALMNFRERLDQAKKKKN